MNFATYENQHFATFFSIKMSLVNILFQVLPQSESDYNSKSIEQFENF